LNIIVQKYGGTSVNSVKLRNNIVENLKRAKEKGNLSVIVVSAMGRQGEPYATDSLLKLISSSHRNTRNADMLVSCGEIISSVVIAAHLADNGFDAIALTGRQAGIITDSHFGESTALDVKTSYLHELLLLGKIPVVAGFQGANVANEITTLGRGGSDTSAVLLGIALKAKEVEIFTDVDGIMTADPKIVPDAKLIHQIAYDDVFQLAQYGAKVIHPRAVELAMKNNIPLKVYNTCKYEDDSGTQINSDHMDKNNLVAAIAHEHGKIQWHLNIFSSNSQVFNEISDKFISIDMINVFKQESVFITNETHKKELIDILHKLKIDYKITEELTKVTIIGSKIQGVPGIMSKVVTSLQGKIDILQSSDSHTTISILVPTMYANKAVNLLHKAYQLDD